MIKEINIQNFQSHKSSTLIFDKGVNIITGTSDCGKSAVLRALKWLVYNKPRGDSFRSLWGGKTQISIKLEDGSIITREKDKENKYIIKQGENTSTFKALGNDIPNEILSILNMDEINLQQQLDSPFLLSKSPGEVALHFNRIAKLSKIDTSSKYIQSWIRQITQKIENNKDNLANLQKALSEYSYLSNLEQDIIIFEQWQEQLNNITIKLTLLSSSIRQSKRVNFEIKQKQLITQAEKPVNELLLLIKQRKQIKARKLLIGKLIDSVNGINYRIGNIQKNIKADGRAHV